MSDISESNRPIKRMLIDASHKEEHRIAIVVQTPDNRYIVEDYKSQRHDKLSQKGNIILATLSKNQQSLNASFLDIDTERHAFLPEKELANEYLPDQGDRRPRLDDILKPNQRILVQVEKDQRGSKGAAVTTFISLPGCYLVLMPNNPRAGGISRRIEGEERSQLREVIEQLDVPDNMGLIVRTAGVGKSVEELQWDLSILLKQWEAIRAAADASEIAPKLIYQERDFVLTVIRDYLRQDVEEILINDQKTYDRFIRQVNLLRPDLLNRIKLYQERIPLFSRYYIEGQVATAYQHTVRLPSGGSIVIDDTEALTAVDINSSRATKGEDIEATALNTNLEAATEVAKQIRIRDTGGLIVIDFIDMSSQRAQREVENRLRDELRVDRARVRTGKIDRFGLLNMSRQRLHPALKEFSHEPCPRCNGQGMIRGIETLTLSILRVMEEEALRFHRKGKNMKIVAQLPVDAATFILNEKRADIDRLESTYSSHILIIPNPNIETPKFKIEATELTATTVTSQVSYKLVEQIDMSSLTDKLITGTETHAESAEIENMMFPGEEKKSGFMSRLVSSLLGTKPEDKEQEKPGTEPTLTSEEVRKPKDSNTRTRGKRSGGGDRRPRSGGGQQRRQGSGSSGGRAGQQQRSQRPRNQSAQVISQDTRADENATKQAFSSTHREHTQKDNREVSKKTVSETDRPSQAETISPPTRDLPETKPRDKAVPFDYPTTAPPSSVTGASTPSSVQETVSEPPRTPREETVEVPSSTLENAASEEKKATNVNETAESEDRRTEGDEDQQRPEHERRRTRGRGGRRRGPRRHPQK